MVYKLQFSHVRIREKRTLLILYFNTSYSLICRGRSTLDSLYGRFVEVYGRTGISLVSTTKSMSKTHTIYVLLSSTDLPTLSILVVPSSLSSSERKENRKGRPS